MFPLMRALLGRAESGERAAAEAGADTGELQLAAAALLVEAAVMDGHFDDAERDTVLTLVREHFGLDAGAAGDLIEEAAKAVRESGQLYGFTRVVKDRFGEEERVRMIEMLWEVAYADGSLHDYEASLVRRVSGLLYVPDRESGAARKRVLERLGMTGAAK